MMRPISPIFAICICLLFVASMLAAPLDLSIAGENNDGKDGAESIYGDEIGDSADDPDPLVTLSHLMTQSEMEELRSTIGVYDGETTSAVKATGLRKPTADEWQAMVGNVTIVDRVTAPSLKASSSVDLSTSAFFPAIGDQGSLGSCGAWAEIYYALGYLTAKANGWTNASLNYPYELLSPLWTYDLQNGGYDMGSYLGANTEVAKTIGVATLATMPYKANANIWGSEEAWRDAAAHQAESYHTISYNALTEISTIKSLLSSGTPVVFSIYASEFMYNYADWKGNRNNIISSGEYSALEPNHAQTIVGYYDEMSDNGEQGVFKVANSWGSDFGVDGYYYITYDAFLELVSNGGEAGFVTLEEDAPSALAVWHYNVAPGRDARITVSAVSTTSGQALAKVEPYICAYTNGLPKVYAMPYFMCLDISSLSSYLGLSSVDIVLEIGSSVISYSSGESPTLSSFRVEEYAGGYRPGNASTITDQASGLPAVIPCQAYISQRPLSEISTADALDWDYPALSFAGNAQWVGVDSGNGSSSSLQSGDVGDRNSSMFIAFVDGPGTISFDWKVSSETDYDFLRFYVDGSLICGIAGEQSWARVHLVLPSGPHNLTWSYEKDEYVSAGDDCGWIDNVQWTGSEVIAYTGFEGTLSGMSCTDENVASGQDTWGVIGKRSNSGASSAWCAASGYGANGLPNMINRLYDTNMEGIMLMTLPDLSDHSLVQLTFHYWAATGSSSLSDRLYVEAYTVQGGWAQVWTQPSASSEGWDHAQVLLSNVTTMVRFGFHSDALNGNYEGVYLDDVLLTVADTVAPSSYVGPLPAYTSSNITALVCHVNDGTPVWDGHVQIYYSFGGSGTYSLYAPSYNPSGIWSVTSVIFYLEEAGNQEGEYRFYSVATDLKGNVESLPPSYDASTVFDLSAPTTAASTDVASPSSWNHQNVTVTLTPSDAASGVSFTMYRIDGGPWTSYSGSFIVSGDGSHTVRYYSVDAAGNTEITSSLVVKIDHDAPVLTITSPISWALVGNSVLTWSASDISGIVLTEVSTDGSNWTIVYGMTLALPLGDGPHTAYVRATDAAGWVSVASVYFILDSTEPSLILHSPAGGPYLNSSSVTISWSASDALSEIGHYEVSIDGIYWIFTTSTSYHFSGLEDGCWTIYVRAYDAAGNLRERTTSIIIDTVPPTAEVTPTGDGVAITSDIVIRFSETMSTASVIITVDGIQLPVSWSGNEARCTPSFLERDRHYAAVMHGQDLAGNEVGTTWTFETTGNGEISGTLTDEGGAPLANVIVKLSSGITTSTDAFGQYTFSNVTAGTYTMTVEQDGFEPLTLVVEVVGGESTSIGTSRLSAADGGGLGSDVLILALILALAIIIVLGMLMVKRRH